MAKGKNFVSFAYGVSGDLKEILASSDVFNDNIPNATYVPAVQITIITSDGKAYKGAVRVDPLIAHLTSIRK